MTPKRPLLDSTPDALRDWIVAAGYPAYRAKQVLRWVAERRGESFGVMDDLPKRLREALDADWTVFATEVDHHDTSPDGTDKLLLACPDGASDRVCAHGRRRSPDRLRQHAGGLRDGVRLLRQPR